MKIAYPSMRRDHGSEKLCNGQSRQEKRFDANTIVLLRCLDLEQQLAVAKDSLRKKENNIQSLDQTMKQLIDKWRDQENERQVSGY